MADMTVKVEIKDFEEVKNMIDTMAKMVDALGFEHDDLERIQHMTQEELNKEMIERVRELDKYIS